MSGSAKQSWCDRLAKTAGQLERKPALLQSTVSRLLKDIVQGVASRPGGNLGGTTVFDAGNGTEVLERQGAGVVVGKVLLVGLAIDE